jgi:3-oxoadipate enol-lactonase
MTIQERPICERLGVLGGLVQSTANIDGLSVAYSMDGNATAPVVVFSNGLAADQSMWEPQARVLREKYRVLRYDTRGHGGTAATRGDYSLSLLVHDIISLLDELGIQKAHFVGLSLGGMIGQSLALTHGSRLLSLTLCATMSDSPKAAWASRVRAVREKGLASVVDATIDRWFTAAYCSENPAAMARMRAMVMGTSRDGYAGCAAAIRDMKLGEAISGIKVPTLVIAGEDDTSTPLSVLQGIAQAIENAELVKIANAAHLPNLERPERVTEEIERFLRRSQRDEPSASLKLTEGSTL